MTSVVKHTVALLTLASGLSGSAMGQVKNDPVNWVQAYENVRAERSVDYLLDCWAEQWPGGVKAYEGPSAATEVEIKAAILATRDHCKVQIEVRLDQIKVDLARQGMLADAIEAAAPQRLEAELTDMFGEYWSRL